MKEIFLKLAELADSLDKKGRYNLANDIDVIILKYSNEDKQSSLSKFESLYGKELSVDIPKEEYDGLKYTFEDLDASLKGVARDQEKEEESEEE